MSSLSSRHLPTLGGLGLASVVVAIVLTLGARDSSSLDQLEGGVVASPSGEPVGEDGKLAPGPAGTSSAPGSTGSSMVSPGLSDAALDAATDKTALEALSKTFPNDPRVWKKLAGICEKTGDLDGAMLAVRRELALVPDSVNDESIRRLVLRAASAGPSAADLAFDTMSSAMGQAGPDLLYEIAVAQGTGQNTKDRAMAALRDPAVRERESPALQVAVDLRSQSGCGRKPYVEIAERDGDQRSVPYLEQVQQRKGCGFLGMGDCFGCFGERTAINRAVKTIKERSNTPPHHP